MLVITEHRPADGAAFLADAGALLTVLAESAGYGEGFIGRSPDDTSVYILATRWSDVGSMRRGFGRFEAKVAAGPVMLSAVDRVSAFEILAEVASDRRRTALSDRAPD